MTWSLEAFLLGWGANALIVGAFLVVMAIIAGRKEGGG